MNQASAVSAIGFSRSPVGTNQLLALRNGRTTRRRSVVAWDDGQPIPPDTITKAFRKTMRVLGLDIRYHDLRHAHCSDLLAAGVPVKAVSGRVGHSSAKMTLDIYQHLLDDADQIAANVVGRAFGGNSVAKTPSA